MLARANAGATRADGPDCVLQVLSSVQVLGIDVLRLPLASTLLNPVNCSLNLLCHITRQRGIMEWYSHRLPVS